MKFTKPVMKEGKREGEKGNSTDSIFGGMFQYGMTIETNSGSYLC